MGAKIMSQVVTSPISFSVPVTSLLPLISPDAKAEGAASNSHQAAQAFTMICRIYILPLINRRRREASPQRKRLPLADVVRPVVL
ncbi:hypothetical protein D3C74_464730 [compost metagenome]